MAWACQAPLSRQEDWSGCHDLLFQHDIPIFIKRHLDLQRAGPEFYGRNIPFLTELDMEATVRKRHGKTAWFKIGKRVRQGCILSPRLSNLYTEDIMRDGRLDEVQAGINIAGRNISNFRYAYDTTCKAKSEEELKSHFVKIK